MGVAEHYTYRVRWSGEAGEYVGTIAELPSLSWLSPDRTEAFAGIQQLAADAVADMLGYGETPAGGDRRPRLLRQVHGPDPARAPPPARHRRRRATRVSEPPDQRQAGRLKPGRRRRPTGNAHCVFRVGWAW